MATRWSGDFGLYIILTARYVGERIRPGVRSTTLGIAYVVDDTVLADATLDFKKCYYLAIGTAHEIKIAV